MPSMVVGCCYFAVSLGWGSFMGFEYKSSDFELLHLTNSAYFSFSFLGFWCFSFFNAVDIFSIVLFVFETCILVFTSQKSALFFSGFVCYLVLNSFRLVFSLFLRFSIHALWCLYFVPFDDCGLLQFDIFFCGGSYIFIFVTVHTWLLNLKVLTLSLLHLNRWSGIVLGFF